MRFSEVESLRELFCQLVIDLDSLHFLPWQFLFAAFAEMCGPSFVERDASVGFREQLNAQLPSHACQDDLENAVNLQDKHCVPVHGKQRT